MKNKFISIKFKLILAFLLSIVISFISSGIVFILIFGLMELINKELYITLLNNINNSIASIVLLMGLYFILFIVNLFLVFIRLISTRLDYMEEIQECVEEFQLGKSDRNLEIKGNDELSTLAKAINDMTYKINHLVNEERQWESSKNELITNMSHDLRTPLTSLSGFIDAIKNKKYSNEEMLNHYLDIVSNKCSELNKLINYLLEYSKLTNYNYKLKPIKFNINELIMQVISSFTIELEESKMEIRYNPIKSINIVGDPMELGRVIENLISNSIKYGKSEKGIEINSYLEGNNVRIIVRNFGEPIAKKDIDYVFERFYTGETGRSKRVRGSGIGLAIAKRIIELHGGNIVVTSDLNKTEFTIYLKEEYI